MAAGLDVKAGLIEEPSLGSGSVRTPGTTAGIIFEQQREKGTEKSVAPARGWPDSDFALVLQYKLTNDVQRTVCKSENSCLESQ